MEMNRLISIKMIKLSLTCVLVFTLMMTAAGCLNLFSDYYSLADATTVDDILYCKKRGNDSETVMIGSWWDGETTEIVYEIPDTYEGRNVVWLGDKSYGFVIHQPSEYVSYDSKDGILYLKSTDEKVDCAGFTG